MKFAVLNWFGGLVLLSYLSIPEVTLANKLKDYTTGDYPTVAPTVFKNEVAPTISTSEFTGAFVAPNTQEECNQCCDQITTGNTAVGCHNGCNLLQDCATQGFQAKVLGCNIGRDFLGIGTSALVSSGKFHQCQNGAVTQIPSTEIPATGIINIKLQVNAQDCSNCCLQINNLDQKGADLLFQLDQCYSECAQGNHFVNCFGLSDTSSRLACFVAREFLAVGESPFADPDTVFVCEEGVLVEQAVGEEDNAQDNNDDSIVAIIAGSSAAATALILLIALLVTKSKRRKKKDIAPPPTAATKKKGGKKSGPKLFPAVAISIPKAKVKKSKRHSPNSAVTEEGPKGRAITVSPGAAATKLRNMFKRKNNMDNIVIDMGDTPKSRNRRPSGLRPSVRKARLTVRAGDDQIFGRDSNKLNLRLTTNVKANIKTLRKEALDKNSEEERRPPPAFRPWTFVPSLLSADFSKAKARPSTESEDEVVPEPSNQTKKRKKVDSQSVAKLDKKPKVNKQSKTMKNKGESAIKKQRSFGIRRKSQKETKSNDEAELVDRMKGLLGFKGKQNHDNDGHKDNQKGLKATQAIKKTRSFGLKRKSQTISTENEPEEGDLKDKMKKMFKFKHKKDDQTQDNNDRIKSSGVVLKLEPPAEPEEREKKKTNFNGFFSRSKSRKDEDINEVEEFDREFLRSGNRKSMKNIVAGAGSIFKRKSKIQRAESSDDLPVRNTIRRNTLS